jgi:hypothetical protein
MIAPCAVRAIVHREGIGPAHQRDRQTYRQTWSTFKRAQAQAALAAATAATVGNRVRSF